LYSEENLSTQFAIYEDFVCGLPFLFAERANVFDGCWPLDDRQVEQIRRSQRDIGRLLDVGDELLDYLESDDCFTCEQLEGVRDNPKRTARTTKLVQMLLAGSQNTLKLFVKCLETNQKHLVPFFTGDNYRIG
jgi:hypothetical protein